MHQLRETVNNRKVFYFDVKDSLAGLQEMELSEWIVFVIADSLEHPLLDEFVNLCIDKGVIYACASGKAGSSIDDKFDMAVVMREMEQVGVPTWYQNDDDVLMTNWHQTIDEGYWFAAVVVRYEGKELGTIVVVNFTNRDLLPKIEELTVKIQSGWSPS
jgi:hypothetical protein